MSIAIDRLVDIMGRLRSPDGGCPWDREQTFKTLAPYTLEETYEVVDAIERDDTKELINELGDLLFQIVFYAEIGEEKDLFSLDTIATSVTEKMIERHPHVFGDRIANTAESIANNWEADKAKKREAQAKAENRLVSVLDGLTPTLPSMSLALKLQNRVARVGFDWPSTVDIIAKIKEEILELEYEISAGTEETREEEFGDLLFTVVNLGRKLNLDPETSLRRANRKFERRFRALELRITESGKSFADISLQDMETNWAAVKKTEKHSI